MTEIEIEFDTVFKWYGGIYRDGIPDLPILRFAVGHSRMIIDSISGDHPHFPKAYVNIVDSTVLGAWATRGKDGYLIGITSGTILLFHDLLLRMMCSGNILPAIGDVSREVEIKKIPDAQVTDYAQLSQLSGRGSPDPKPDPVDPVRKAFVIYSLEMMIEYLIFHEYAHILFGHVDYYRSELGAFGIGEYDTSAGSEEGNRAKSDTCTEEDIETGEDGAIEEDKATEEDIAALISQTLEMDADSFATTRAMEKLNAFHHNPGWVIPELRMLYSDWPTMISYWVFPVYTFFRILGRINSAEELKTSSHPAPSIRAHLSMATIYANIDQKYDRAFLEHVGQVCTDAMYTVEEAFREISEQGLDLSAFRFSVSEESMQHARFLMKNWNNVRPLLEPFTHSPLTPLKAD